MPDLHPFENIQNFREFGGQPVPDGSQVAPGRLFRGAHLARATERDVDRLESLDIRLIVDLRRPGERQREPDRPVGGAATTIIASELGGDGEAPHVAFLQSGDVSDASVEAFMLDFYENAPDDPQHRDVFQRTFIALQDLSGAVLVHCAAGKDRTGILVALIQTMLGVHPDLIMQDYLQTNRAMLTPAGIAAASAHLQGYIGHPPSETVVHALLGVRDVYLRRAFQAIAERHGSVDAYLDGLGIDAASRSRIRAQLIARPVA